MIYKVEILGIYKFIIENDMYLALKSARKMLLETKSFIKEIDKNKKMEFFTYFQKYMLKVPPLYELYMPNKTSWLKFVTFKLKSRTEEEIELDNSLIKKYYEIINKTNHSKNKLRIATYVETATKMYNELVFPEKSWIPKLYYSYYVEDVLLSWMSEYLEINNDLLTWILPIKVEKLAI